MGNLGHDAVDVRDAVKRFGNFEALKGVSLRIRDNEFFTLLGPSGCGKTTLLRLIAGFEDVSEGAIFLFGEEIENLPPHRRPVNTVFQNYALFPHMSVLENVAFGPEMLGQGRDVAQKRAGEMLELVHLTDFAARRPAQLSGGQQQRVALARALAPRPKVLLLDEPLSALDLKLRKAMQLELKTLQRETGITFIFVTHDQEEALTMSDRIAVMSAGELQQVGAAREIYERPRNVFVADFVGETNLLEVRVEAIDGGRASCRLASGHRIDCPAVSGIDVGAAVHLSVRPERLRLSAPDEGGLLGQVEENVFVGTDINSFVRIDNGPRLSVRSANSDRGGQSVFEIGARVLLQMEPEAPRLLID